MTTIGFLNAPGDALGKILGSLTMILKYRALYNVLVNGGCVLEIHSTKSFYTSFKMPFSQIQRQKCFFRMGLWWTTRRPWDPFLTTSEIMKKKRQSPSSSRSKRRIGGQMTKQKMGKSNLTRKMGASTDQSTEQNETAVFFGRMRRQ